MWSTPEISLWEVWGSAGHGPSTALALWQLPGTELWTHKGALGSLGTQSTSAGPSSTPEWAHPPRQSR